jgi:hypothetical protein
VSQIVCVAVVLLAALCAHAQDLPSKLRGYKVYKTNITVRAGDAPDAREADVLVKLGEPKLRSIALSGASIELPAEITSHSQTGRIEMVAFYNITVNGLAVEIDDLVHRFDLKKNVPVELPAATVRIGAIASAKGSFRELTDGKTEWRVKGTAFVFGRFKRFGLTFKRVIPVDLDLVIPNPLRT